MAYRKTRGNWLVLLAHLYLANALSDQWYFDYDYGPLDFKDTDPFPIRKWNVTSLGYDSFKYPAFSYHKKYFMDLESDTRFSYNLDSPIGPPRWKYKFPHCGTPQQSPVDLDLMRCRFKRLRRPLRYYRGDSTPQNVTIENNGYSIEYSFDFLGPRPVLYGGPLRSAYIFEQIHFHWGPININGGEHHINTKTYQLEMHVTHRNARYPNLETAAQFDDGIAAIGVLFEVSKYQDDWHFFRDLRQLRMVNSSVQMNGFPDNFRLLDIVGSLGEQYIAYRGSLTTPPCSPTSWLVSSRIRKVSRRDMRNLREVFGLEGYLSPNFRILQPRDKLQCLVF